MQSIRQYYTLMPWWAGLPVVVLGGLTIAVVGAVQMAWLAVGLLIAGVGSVTWYKFRTREQDRVARIVYFANPERAGEERLYDLIVGQIWLGFIAIVAFAALGAALLGPFGALFPAGILAARNLLSEGDAKSSPQRGTQSPAIAGAIART